MFLSIILLYAYLTGFWFILFFYYVYCYKYFFKFLFYSLL